MKLPLPSCWPKGPRGNSQTIKVIAKTNGCYPKTDIKILLVRTTPTQLEEHREMKLIPI